MLMQNINYSITTQALKQIKKTLPRNCTFLSLIDRKGRYYLQAKVNGEDFALSMPMDLTELNEEDYERIYQLILEKCLQQS